MPLDSVVAVGSVGLSAHHELRTHVAEIGVTAGTGRALAARRDESEHHVVTGAQVLDPGTDFFDHTRPLVAPDDRVHAPEVTGPQMLIAVAHTRCPRF